MRVETAALQFGGTAEANAAVAIGTPFIAASLKATTINPVPMYSTTVGGRTYVIDAQTLGLKIYGRK
jgi:hypothetical protein